ncbi:hypothetical protein HIM_08204 [Hirsutella minnesotensis 3608]|uniref:Uncharacterized protein n=1 Tax=Hirsutella minnesotensis 3608 TaxID=1043627 RepID=A0A0F7ZHC5_9HYPO|nr:hypothetical protein HIM_08204 [Hirsutella minnesotensis 3608]
MASVPSVGNCISDDTRECMVMAPGAPANKHAAASFDSAIQPRQQRNTSSSEPRVVSSQDGEGGHDVGLTGQEASVDTVEASETNTPQAPTTPTSTSRSISIPTSSEIATATADSSPNMDTPPPNSSETQASSDEVHFAQGVVRAKSGGGGGGGKVGGGKGGGGKGGGGGGAGRGGGGQGKGKGQGQGQGKGQQRNQNGGGGQGKGKGQGQGQGKGQQRNQKQQTAALSGFGNPTALGANTLLGFTDPTIIGLAAVRQGQLKQQKQQQQEQQQQEKQQKAQEKQQQQQQQQQLQQQIQQQQQQIEKQQQQIQQQQQQQQRQQQQQQQSQSRQSQSQRQTPTQSTEATVSASQPAAASSTSTASSSVVASVTPSNAAAAPPKVSKAAQDVRASAVPQQPSPAQVSPVPPSAAPPSPSPAEQTTQSQSLSQSVATPKIPSSTATETSTSSTAESAASATAPAGSATASSQPPAAPSSTTSSSTTTATPQVNLGAQVPPAPSSSSTSTSTQGTDQSSSSGTRTETTQPSAISVSSTTSVTTTSSESPTPSVTLGKAGSNTGVPSTQPSKDDNNNNAGNTGAQPKSSSSPESTNQAPRGLSKGGVVGLSTGVIGAVFLVLLAVWLWKKSKAKKRGDTPASFLTRGSPDMAERDVSGGHIPRARMGAEKLASSLGFLRRGSMSQVEGNRQPRISQGPRQVWAAAAVPGESFGEDANFANPVSHFRPELGLNTEGFGDPFADVNAMSYGAAFMPPAGNRSSNPFVDPRPDSMAFTSGNRPPSHSRSRSESVYNSYYPPPPVAFRPSYAVRESLQSNTAFGERRNKFRSDPFDLESRLAPSEDDIAQMPRLNEHMSTYSSHTRGSSLPYSQYSSGVSVSDWSAIGAETWPPQAGQSQEWSGDGGRRGDRNTVGQAL